MAKLMTVRSDDDYRAMIIFKGLLMMGIENVPLITPEKPPPQHPEKEREVSCP